MVKIVKILKNGKNSLFWSLNQPGVGRRRETQNRKHIWKASKIPLLSRCRKDFSGLFGFLVKNSVFGSKKADFGWFLAIFDHFCVWINAGWCITVNCAKSCQRRPKRRFYGKNSLKYGKNGLNQVKVEIGARRSKKWLRHLVEQVFLS